MSNVGTVLTSTLHANSRSDMQEIENWGVPQLLPQGHAGHCIQGEEIPEETSCDAEHVCGSWHGRGPYSRWMLQEKAMLYHPVEY